MPDGLMAIIYQQPLTLECVPWIVWTTGWVEPSDMWMMITILTIIYLSVTPNPLMGPPTLHQPRTAAALDETFAPFQGREGGGGILNKKSIYSGRGTKRNWKVLLESSQL